MSKKYWFKRKRYGWGWTPVTWQGWISTLLLIGAGLALGYVGEASDAPGLILIAMTIVIAVFYGIARKHSPSPKWRWGKSKDDNKEEDF